MPALRRGRYGFVATTPSNSMTCEGPRMRVLLVNVSRAQSDTILRALREDGSAGHLLRDTKADYERAAQVHCDAILLVVQRDAENAARAVRRWRRRNLNAGLLVLAPSRDASLTVQIIDNGADDCISMPFSRSELVARLKAVARRRQALTPAVVHVGDLEIDSATQSVSRGGDPVSLTKTQYAILQLLAFHRGRIVTRRMILDHIYDDPEGPESNVMEVHIRNLRRKIDGDAEPPLIVTRWGEGYMLRGED
jgi:DNA-binding response OmpR family regulator